MKLSVSNIAWGPDEDAAALPLLAELGVTGLEVAPTRVFPNWEGMANVELVRRFRAEVESHGLRISSLQSILFQKPDLQLFGTAPGPLLDHLEACARFAAELGATAMVFGAPKNRDRGSLTSEAAFDSAAGTFAKAAARCAPYGVMLAIEPNPTEYACNFVTTCKEAARLVQTVASPWFRLHLDSACMHLAGDPAFESITANLAALVHFHVSEPFLSAVGENPVAHHSACATALRDGSYTGWTALEMRRATGVDPLTAVARAVRFVQEVYGA